MRPRPALTVSVALFAASASLAPVVAANAKPRPKPKPVTRTYLASAPLPSPVNVQTGVCHADLPQSADDQLFTAPFAGRLFVRLYGFVGDWDLTFRGAAGTAAASRQQVTDAPDRPEEIDAYRMKRGEAVTIRACNFSGGPSATVSYTHSAF
jgi:hypothetical protein